MKEKSSRTWIRRLAAPLALSIAVLSLGGIGFAQARTSASAAPTVKPICPEGSERVCIHGQCFCT